MHNTDAKDQHKSDYLKINRLSMIIKSYLVIFKCQGFINADTYRQYNPDKILSNSIFISFEK
jgi:hypothetical protein